MKIKKFIEIYCKNDSNVESVELFDTEDDAKSHVITSMREHVNNNANKTIDVDFDNMSIVDRESSSLNRWSIKEIEIDIPEMTYVENLDKLRNNVENDVNLSYRSKTTMVESIMKMKDALKRG